MRTLFLSLLLLSAPVAGLVAQTMHIILVVNTQEPGRSVDRTADYTSMRQFFTECAQYAGMTPRVTHLGQSKFNSASVRSTCASLNVATTDAVVFYFSGHGANDGTAQWPVLALTDGLLPMPDVIRALRERNPKFLMVMADCCNNYFNGTLPPAQANAQDPGLYRSLFREFKGKRIVLVSASQPGEYSYSDKQQGAVWGNCFREAMHRTADNGSTNTDWQAVLGLGKQLTISASDGKQTAQFDVDTLGDPFDE